MYNVRYFIYLQQKFMNMKDKVKEILKKKYSNLGFGDEVLESIANNLAEKITDENEIENKVAEMEGVLKIFQSKEDKTRTKEKQLSKEIEDLKKKLAEISSENPKKDKGEDKENQEIPTWAKALNDEIVNLKSQLEQEKGKNLLADRQKKFSNITSKLPDALKKSYERYDLMRFTDEEFENLTSEVEKEVTNINTSLNAKGAVFNPPLGGEPKKGNSISDKDAKDVASMIKI